MKHRLFTFLIFVSLCFFSFGQSSKINGVSLVSSPAPTTKTQIATVSKVAANWVAVIPYSFIKKNTAKVIYDTQFQWSGERLQGVTTMIKQAKETNLKVMLKPHVWVQGDGWAGDFTLQTEAEWKQWETSYSGYILSYARLAQQHRVDLFCIGTELRQVVKLRPAFWLILIKNVKSVYKGKLTYAANWDNYQNITFWGELDFISIDSYFPLSNDKTPSVEDLNTAWNPIKRDLKDLSACNKKPILFTEYGYTSSDYCAKESWANSNGNALNEQAQANAYQSVFETFWNEDWFAGGFLWKWHLQQRTKRNIETNFTPQDKLASKVIAEWYGDN